METIAQESEVSVLAGGSSVKDVARLYDRAVRRQRTSFMRTSYDSPASPCSPVRMSRRTSLCSPVSHRDAVCGEAPGAMHEDQCVLATPRARSVDARRVRRVSGTPVSITAEQFSMFRTPERRGRLSTTSVATSQGAPSEGGQSHFDIEDEFCADWQRPHSTSLDWPLSQQEKKDIVVRCDEADRCIDQLPTKVLQYLESQQVMCHSRQMLESKAVCVCGSVFMGDSIYCRMCGKKRSDFALAQSTATPSSHPKGVGNLSSLDAFGVACTFPTDDCSKISQCESESNLDGRESLLSFSEIGSQYSSRAESARMRKMLEHMNHNVKVTMKRSSMLEEKIGKLREERNSLKHELAEEQDLRAVIVKEITTIYQQEIKKIQGTADNRIKSLIDENKKLKSDKRNMSKEMDKMEEEIEYLCEQLDIAEEERKNGASKAGPSAEPLHWSSWLWQSQQPEPKPLAESGHVPSRSQSLSVCSCRSSSAESVRSKSCGSTCGT